MGQDVKRTDQAVDAVDKIVGLGRSICERKKRLRGRGELPSQGSDLEPEKSRNNDSVSGNPP
jgi:hypothetical protein